MLKRNGVGLIQYLTRNNTSIRYNDKKNNDTLKFQIQPQLQIFDPSNPM